MSIQSLMIDRATGSSPPPSHTRDIGTSPIHFISSSRKEISNCICCSTTLSREEAHKKNFDLNE